MVTRPPGSRTMHAATSVILGMVVTVCWAATPGTDLANVPPNFDAVESAARQIRSSGCVTSQCQAMLSIADVLRIDLDAVASTVGRPKPIPADRDAIAAKSLQKTLLGHPERFTAVCDGATRLMTRYSLPGGASDVFVPVNLLLLGLEMDQRSRGRCLQSLLSALPRTGAATTAIDDAQQLCVGRRHSPALCNEIKRS